MSPRINSQNQHQDNNSNPKPTRRETHSELTNGLLPTPNELVKMLSEQVIGQDQAKRALAVSVYQHAINCARADLHGGEVEAENHVLLAGPTGSGKSILLRRLAHILDLKVFFIPCTAITPDGYRGKNFGYYIDSIAKEIVHEGYTRPAIVVWDEVDKLALHGNNQSEAALYRRMVQMEFLTYLDGTRCGSEAELDSSRILNVALGAFVGVETLRDPSIKPVIGFQSRVAKSSGNLPELTPEHLIAYGLIPEFVGRFSRISTLEPLDCAALRRVLTEAKGSVLARRKSFFALHQIRLEFSDDAIDELVIRALAHDTGARALRQVIDQALRIIEHRVPEMAQGGVHTVVMDRSAVQGLTAPIEHKGDPLDLSELIDIRRQALGFEAKADDIDADDLCIF
jgi:ATP-dependent Clp protease ATP-binding subunit ClpX